MRAVEHLDDELAQHYTRLKADGEALPWRDRRELVRVIRRLLESGKTSAMALKLLHLLTNDSRGEVRAEIAESLTHLPDQDFLALSAKLLKDDYAFAAHAAERALARRRKGQDDLDRRERALEGVEEEYSRIVRKFGVEAAELARHIAEKLYETQIGGTVHTMRTLLSPLRARLDNLQAQVDIAQHRETLRKCSDLSALLEKHLLNLREYARPVNVERNVEKLSALLIDAEQRARESLESEKRFPDGVRISRKVPDTIFVQIAREQMVVAFTNVIKNALEALPSKGKPGSVRIIAHVESDLVEITISDNGAGLTELELSALRAFRAGQTTLKTYGTGWGLPQAHKTICAHGGSLSLKSLMGKGTTVTAILPIVSEDDNP